MNPRILYIEATSGISGDMLLGALLDCGVPPEILSEAWSALEIDNYRIEITETSRSGMRALRCRIETQEEKGIRSWKAYESLLRTATLPDPIKNQTLKLVRRLFEIEAEAHGVSIGKLHLHEMGGTDLLLDVVGTLSAVDYLQPAIVCASPVNTGRGFISFSHGRYPVPAPAVAKLLEGIPVFQNEVEGELATPTGALLVRHMAQSYGPLPSLRLEMTGTGAGDREIPGHPNVLRIFIGTATSADEDIYMVETNIDDSSPQILAHFMERAFEEGALDVFFTPITMKKNRPAVRLTLLMPGSLRAKLVELLFAETTAIGLRYWKVDRTKLERRWKKVRVQNNEIRIKESYLDGRLYNHQPEFEDCKRAAARLKLPIKQIMAAAIHQYLSR